MNGSRDNDMWALVAIGTVAVLAGVPAVLLGLAGDTLRAKRILLEPGEGIITIPHLGSLDLPRVLIAAVLVVVVITVARSAIRGRDRAQHDQT